MALLTNEAPVIEQAPEKSKQPKIRFVIGSTGCYFEVADYLCTSTKITEAKAKSLGSNPSMYLEDTLGVGRSLKVMKKTDPKKNGSFDGEIKFQGFITAGDKKIELCMEEHGDMILEAWKTEPIMYAIGVDELVDSW